MICIKKSLTKYKKTKNYDILKMAETTPKKHIIPILEPDFSLVSLNRWKKNSTLLVLSVESTQLGELNEKLYFY